MNFHEQTGKTIEEAWFNYHSSNPKFYDLIIEQVMKAINKGKTKVSIKLIINWIRWNVEIEVNSIDVYKINDAFAPHYARLFIKDYPEHSDIFNFRELRDGSEKGMVRPVDEYRIEILKKMIDGKVINYYKLNNLAYLVDPKNTELQTTESITSPSFNKLVKDRFIVPMNPTELMIEYAITRKGIAAVNGTIKKKVETRKPKNVRVTKPAKKKVVRKPVAAPNKKIEKKKSDNQLQMF